jgi:perosamine synthetase
MSQERHIIPVARPWMDEPEADAARRVILSGWITQGPEVAAFEREFAAYVGAKHACAVSNCTTALHLALLAVGVRPGDEVVTVSHSFIATANSVRYCGGIPVFVDVEPDTFNMDLRELEKAITPRTRAILCVHQLGMPANLEAIVEIARRHRLPVVEDAACAVGSEILWDGRWERIGRPHGDVACFSFHPRKLLSTGDGGMITCSDPDHDHRFRLWRQHGMSVSDVARHTSRQVVFESYPVLGYNYRLTDLQAAVGREQLKRLPLMVDRRRALAARYDRLLRAVPGLVPPRDPPWARSNWQSYCVRLPDACEQRAVMQFLLDAGVSARRGVMCAHREAPYAAEGRRLPHSEEAQDRTIILPLFHQMTEPEQDAVGAALLAACRPQALPRAQSA